MMIATARWKPIRVLAKPCARCSISIFRLHRLNLIELISDDRVNRTEEEDGQQMCHSLKPRAQLSPGPRVVILWPLLSVLALSIALFASNHTLAAHTVLAVSGGGTLIVYCVGRFVVWLAQQDRISQTGHSLHWTIARVSNVAIWGTILFGLAKAASFPPDRPNAGARNEESSRSMLVRLGAELTFDSNGHVAVVELRGVRDEQLAPLRDLEYVTGLHLEGKQTTDAAMVYVIHMHKLEHLWLARTSITDASLVELERFPHLRSIGLSDTGVTDVALGYLAQLTDLEELWLSGTKITDAGLTELRQLHKLRRLYLDRTAISDDGVKGLSPLAQLRELYLRRTSLTDAALEHIGRMESLEQLELGDTKITDAGMPYLRALKRLWLLDMRGTTVSDRGLAYLVGLDRLMSLNLEGSLATDSGVEALRKSLPRCKVSH